jgi:hypothetical protein
MSTEPATLRDDWSLLLLGLFLLTLVGGLLAINVLPEWRANHDYVAARCVVLDKRVVEVIGRKGTTYRGEKGDIAISFQYQLAMSPLASVIIMTVGGWTGEGEEAVNGATARSRKGYAVSGFGVTTHAHEFGHVIWGLSHVDGVRNNIMNGSISDNVNDVMEAFASQRQVDAARRYLIGQDYVE